MKYFSNIKTFSLFLIFIPLCILVNNSVAGELKYIEFSQLGNPSDVLEVKEDNSQSLRSGEVRVRVLAVPINPSDLLQIEGNYGIDPVLPYKPGKEGIGRVLEVSPEIKHLIVGQLVLLIG